MKKYLISFIVIILMFSIALPVSAHRSGCHRWHSCPSDTDSYVCGDLGYTSGCPKTVMPTPTLAPVTQLKTTPVLIETPFIGKPKTKGQLYRCSIVGNLKSHIYHLKGSVHIKGMSLSKKICFATKQEAINAGFRQAKTK